MAEEKNYKQSNKERMLMALALLFPEYKELSVWDWSKILDKKPLLAYKAQYIYDKLNLGLKIENTTRIPEKTVFETAAKISQQGFNETVKETTLTQKYAPVEKIDLSKPDPSKSNTPLISKDTTVIDKSEVIKTETIESKTENLDSKADKIDISNIQMGSDVNKKDAVKSESMSSKNNKIKPVPIRPKGEKLIKITIETEAYYKILGTDDEKTCPNCAKWHNKIICMSGSDPRYPSYDDFLNDHIFHPNCRCSLHPVKVPQPNIERLSMNADPSIKDELLYTGFIDPYIDPKINEDGICKPVTYDYGETLVQLTPLGNYKGWDGEKAVDQIIDEQAIKSIIQELESNPREILVDIDHGSCRSPNERDTQAAAWAYDFKYVKDLGNLSGLYCRLKWTSKGRSLVENREYRFLSPVWTLNLDNRPQKLISIGLTNRPAIKSTPIINTLPEVKEMTEEEIKTLVNSCMDD